MRGASRLERVQLVCGATAGPLFVVVFLIAGATRQDYSPLRHPVSSLAIGESSWVQSASFVVTGLLLLAFAVGLRPVVRRYGGGIWTPILIGLVGVGLLGAGLFTADPIGGYPPGTPLIRAGTTAGMLHDAFSAPVFIALPAACFVLVYRFAATGRPGWAAYSAGTGIGFLVCFVLTSLGFAQRPAFAAIAGMLQRITLVVGFGWLTALAIFFLRSRPDASRA